MNQWDCAGRGPIAHHPSILGSSAVGSCAVRESFESAPGGFETLSGGPSGRAWPTGGSLTSLDFLMSKCDSIHSAAFWKRTSSLAHFSSQAWSLSSFRWVLRYPD